MGMKQKRPTSVDLLHFLNEILSFSFCLQRHYRNVRPVVLFLFEFYQSVFQCVQGVVFSHTYIVTRVVLSSALANNDVSGNCCLTAKYFYT